MVVWRVYRENGDRFSITEAAIAQPSNEEGMKYDRKTVETCVDPRMAVVSFPKALESKTGA